MLGGSLMHRGYYFGTLIASVANYVIGAHLGWRAMFVLGLTPALLIAFRSFRCGGASQMDETRQRDASADYGSIGFLNVVFA